MVERDEPVIKPFAFWEGPCQIGREATEQTGGELVLRRHIQADRHVVPDASPWSKPLQPSPQRLLDGKHRVRVGYVKQSGMRKPLVPSKQRMQQRGATAPVPEDKDRR